MDAMFILFQVPLINKNGTKSMHCIIRGKFVISLCNKSALFWIHAVILLFHAEILPCGPPLLPHSCAEPFLGVMQKYSFLGDIYTSGQHTRMKHKKAQLDDQLPKSSPPATPESLRQSAGLSRLELWNRKV